MRCCTELIISVFDIVGMFDRDNSGGIEFNEFVNLWKYICDWERTFRSYDKDNSGAIDKEELETGTASWIKLFLVLFVWTCSFRLQIAQTSHKKIKK